ncbi:hypothetical protein FALBO_17304, partial [Fusarium albosuccineum]
MLFGKVSITIATFFTLGMAQGSVSSGDYLTEASRQSGRPITELESTLTSNGAKADIDAALAQSQAENNFQDGIACDVTGCDVCTACNQARVDVSIEIAAAWATCAIACVAIVDCPAAIAAATVATAAICSKFCNDQGQPIACDMNCAWAVCDAPARRLLR